MLAITLAQFIPNHIAIPDKTECNILQMYAIQNGFIRWHLWCEFSGGKKGEREGEGEVRVSYYVYDLQLWCYHIRYTYDCMRIARQSLATDFGTLVCRIQLCDW